MNFDLSFLKIFFKGLQLIGATTLFASAPPPGMFLSLKLTQLRSWGLLTTLTFWFNDGTWNFEAFTRPYLYLNVFLSLVFLRGPDKLK